MNGELERQIRASRKRLGNPYAYLDGDGRLDAIPPEGGRDVHDYRRTMQNPYACLDGTGGFSEFDLETQISRLPPRIDTNSVLGGTRMGKRLSRKQIEAIARNLQIMLWHQRLEIFVNGKTDNPRDILDPLIALEAIGYQSTLVESLGQDSSNGEHFEVAGIVDSSKSTVEISRRFSPELRNFTAAHELGHAILHRGIGLHRDRALDGAGVGRARNSREWEADMFATYFLMPEKQIRLAFSATYGTKQLVLNDATAFALTVGDLESLESMCRTDRDFSRLLAGSAQFDGTHFHSLAEQFCVSVEAMAIRLEELDLFLR